MIEEYGLLGSTLGHSFSRAYFTEKFAREGVSARYDNFEMADLSRLRETVRNRPNMRGFNVTIPHKEAVIDFLDEIDPEAAEIGAVNTVAVLPDGRLKGYNTDVYGFAESIRPLLCGKKNLRALVLGTGGASKAVTYVLRGMGAGVTRVSRSQKDGCIIYTALTPELIRSHNVIVNATPVGMYPHTADAPSIPYDGVGDGHVCYDLIYNPAETEFMKRCAERGAKVSNGLEMLHLQAEKAWEIWNDFHARALTASTFK